jgi:hypothetical protein
MIGELFNAMVKEAVGNDPETRRAAALPYVFSKYAAYSYGLGATLSAMSTMPVPAPAPSFAPSFSL